MLRAEETKEIAQLEAMSAGGSGGFEGGSVSLKLGGALVSHVAAVACS